MKWINAQEEGLPAVDHGICLMEIKIYFELKDEYHGERTNCSECNREEFVVEMTFFILGHINYYDLKNRSVENAVCLYFEIKDCGEHSDIELNIDNINTYARQLYVDDQNQPITWNITDIERWFEIE